LRIFVLNGFQQGFQAHILCCTACGDSNNALEGSQTTNLKPILKRKSSTSVGDFCFKRLSPKVFKRIYSVAPPAATSNNALEGSQATNLKPILKRKTQNRCIALKSKGLEKI